MNSTDADLVNTSNRSSAQGTELKHAKITEGIIGAFYEVYNELGHGFLESVYRDALRVVLQSRGYPLIARKQFRLHFGDKLWECSAPTSLCRTQSL